MFSKVTRRRKVKGGKPVFSGSQGCVFIPSLKCKGRPRNMNDGNISKLGYKEGSDFEMREYEKITPFIRKIRNYDKYFNIRVHSCEPDVLSTSDLINFNEVCRHNFDESITAENVNANLDKLRAINMPNLGLDLKEWMEKLPLDARRLRLLNNHISELLLRAVVPMNTMGVMHNDLKSENLMMDLKEHHVRIIDWGLAGVTSLHQVIPARYFMNNPVTYNRPFSTMIISSEIDGLFQNYMSPQRRVTAPEDLKPFVNGLYSEYRNLAPTGHKFLTYIFEAMFNLNPETANAVLTEAVEKYNADILYRFTSADGKFRLHEYFDKVYRYNTDVWGTLSVFYNMFMLPRDHFIMSDAVHQSVLNQYRNIFRTMFVNGHMRMNVRSIVQQVQRINQLFTKAKFNKSVKAVRFNVQSPPVHRRQVKRVPTPYPANP
jgi:hypothetical protein